MKPPRFWTKDGVLALALSPLAALVSLSGMLRHRLTRPVHAAVPVLCVGNVTVGGTGKTPVVLDLATRLQAMGNNPHILTRGYGGKIKGPARVDLARHTAIDVGDEPLLLAATAPVWVGGDRAASAAQAVAAGADILLMDDGFQNPGLAKDAAWVVVDAAVGLGNGQVLPAGPLREPAARALNRAAAMVVMGDGLPDLPSHTRPTLVARIAPNAMPEALHNKPVIAFAGIGRPEKLRDTLMAEGISVLRFYPFPDHHRYRQRELEALLLDAKHHDAILVTTAKDAVRLPAAIRSHVTVLDVCVQWEDPAHVDRMLRDFVETHA